MITLFRDHIGPPIMASVVRELATKRKDLCDESGLAFWPIPAAFPLILSSAIHIAQRRVTALYTAGRTEQAAHLARSRSSIVLLSDEGGDLGEDHCALFLADHPAMALRADAGSPLPFQHFCDTALSIEDPFELIGFVARNEEGSLEEIHALRGARLIASGRYFEVHAANEQHHAEVSERSIAELAEVPEWRQALILGAVRHDALYRTAVESADAARIRAHV